MRLFALEGTIELGGAVAATMDVELDRLEEREFEDGEHKARPLVSVRNEDVYVLHSLHQDDRHSPADKLLRLLLFVATCKENGAARVTAVVPYMAFMRKEVQTKPRDPVNSRYVAQMFEAAGTDMVVSLEVHNPAAFQNAFRCRTTHLDCRHLFSGLVSKMIGDNPIVFLSPDSGGMRRTRALQETFCVATGHDVGLAMMEKHRSEGKVTGELFAGEVAGASVVIVDDMIATGTTMLRAATECRRRGAKQVHAFATHGLFSSGSGDFLTAHDIDSVIVTDSVAVRAGTAVNSKLKIVSCAQLLGDAIRRLHGGGSIHRLLSPEP